MLEAALEALAADADEVQGLWYVTHFAYAGQELMEVDGGFHMSMELRADGEAILDYGETHQVTRWVLQGDNLTFEGNDEFTGTVKDGGITLVDDGGSTLRMARYEMKTVSTMTDLPSAAAAQTAEDYNGTWVVSAVVMAGQNFDAAMLGVDLTVRVADGKAAIITHSDTMGFASAGKETAFEGGSLSFNGWRMTLTDQRTATLTGHPAGELLIMLRVD